MIPFGNEVVTMFHRTETTTSGKHYATYTRTYLQGCSWRVQDTSYLDSQSIKANTPITCRVPVGQTKPMVGDLLIHGKYTGTVTTSADMQAIIEQYRSTYGAFFVKTFADNTMGGVPIPHYKVTGGD